MDSFAGIIVLFIIIGLIEKFSGKSKSSRNTRAASGGNPSSRSVPRPQSFFEEAKEEDGTASAVPAKPVAVPAKPVAVPAKPVAVRQPAAPAQPLPVRPESGAASEDILRKLEAASAIIRSAAAKTAQDGVQSDKKLTDIERSLKAAVGGKPAKADAPLKSGESVTDENGCLGGSLGAHAEEGETHAEHAVHERSRTERLQAEGAVRAEQLRKPGLAELRRAVVMAEILDKPVSMRRRA